MPLYHHITGLGALFVYFTASFFCCCQKPLFVKPQPIFKSHFSCYGSPADAWQSLSGGGGKEEEGQRERGAESKRQDNLFTDRVSIDLHAVVIRMTISGLMASLKGHSMNWERVQLNGQIQSVPHISVQSIKSHLIQ